MSQSMTVLPSADGEWELFRGAKKGRSGLDPKELAGNGAGATIGVPAQYCATFLVTLPTADDSMFADMVFAQVERRGLAKGGPEETVFSYQKIRQDGHSTELSVDVLSAEFPETWCLPKAHAYVASARLLEQPDDRLMLFEEHKRLVLAANHGGKVTHVQVVSAGTDLSEAVAQELNLTALSLQGEGAIVENPDLVVAGKFSEKAKAAFEKASLLPVEFVSGVRIRTSTDSAETVLTPTLVAAARRRRSRARRRNAILAAAALFYAALVVFLMLFAKGRAEQIAALKDEVVEVRPDAEWVQTASNRWRAIEPAVDLRYYPMVQLNQVTRVMPPSGVVIREFVTKGRTVRIRGRARDAQLAFRFEEGLEANEALATYQWNMPNPKVERDNSATFEIQGELTAYAQPE